MDARVISTATVALKAAIGEPGTTTQGLGELFEELTRHLMVWIKNEGGCYLYVSPPFLTRFALDISAVLGRTDAELFPEAAREIRDNDRRVLSTRERIEAVERAHDGQGILTSW